jgi:uncharacterized repeat protein (TIGR04076 family)
MKRTTATVVHVTGKCNAGYQVGDQIVIDHATACIDKGLSDRLCIFALNSILSSMCRLETAKTLLTSCPDPGTGLGGNVLFGLSREECHDPSRSQS